MILFDHAFGVKAIEGKASPERVADILPSRLELLPVACFPSAAITLSGEISTYFVSVW